MVGWFAEGVPRPLGERLMFYAFSGRETLGRPFTYEVELLSDDDSIDSSGSTVTSRATAR